MGIAPLRPWQYAVFRAWRWAMLRQTSPPAALAGLELSGQVREDAQIEWPEWEHDYVPEGGLAGKAVLDVGAGEGETCAFFFEHGAAKVVAIEQDGAKAEALRRNVRSAGWDVAVVSEPFSLGQMFDFDFDFAKIDVEGAEAELLGARSLPPLAMEVHTADLRSRFKTAFPSLKWRRRNWWRDLWIARTP